MSGDVVQFKPSETTRVVPISAEKPSAEWLVTKITALLSIYYQPDEDEDIFRLQMALWRDALSDLPQKAIEMAVRERIRSSSRSRPVPGEIRELAQKFVSYRPARIATDEEGRPFGPDRLPSPEERERFMAMLSDLAKHLGAEVSLSSDRHSVPTLRDVRRVAAQVCDVSEDAIAAPRKAADAVMARFLFCLAAKRLTRKSYPQIGIAIDRDHSTVMAACEKAEERIAGDPEWRAAYAEIERRLTA